MFFLGGFALCGSRVLTHNGFEAGPPEKLLDLESITSPHTFYAYDVLPDDSFIMIESASWEKEPLRIEVVVHWDGRPLGK